MKAEITIMMTGDQVLEAARSLGIDTTQPMTEIIKQLTVKAEEKAREINEQLKSRKETEDD